MTAYLVAFALAPIASASVNQRCSRLTGCGACGKAARSGRRPDQRHEVVEIAPLDWTPEDRF